MWPPIRRQVSVRVIEVDGNRLSLSMKPRGADRDLRGGNLCVGLGRNWLETGGEWWMFFF